jgi:hypothetical protein
VKKPVATMIRRPVSMIVLIVLSLIPSATASAEAQHDSLRGDYSLTLTRTCAVEGPEMIVPQGPGGEQTGIGGGGVIGPFTLQGTVHYDGTGEGTFTGRQTLAVGTGPVGTGTATGSGNEIFVEQATVHCAVTYTVNPNRSVTQRMNCTLTFTTGPHAGQTATLNGITQEGQLSPDGSVLLLSHTATAMEIFIPDYSEEAERPRQRICHGNGMAISLR